MPHDLITQLLRVLAIETKQEKAMVHADPTELTLTGLEAFSFDYVVKWPLSLIINRCLSVPGLQLGGSGFPESSVPTLCPRGAGDTSPPPHPLPVHQSVRASVRAILEAGGRQSLQAPAQPVCPSLAGKL